MISTQISNTNATLDRYISNHKESVSLEKKEETDLTFAAAFISCSPLKEYVASFLF